MRQWRIFPLRSNLSTGVIGAALSLARAKIAIPTQETIAIRMVPKMKATPPSQSSSRPSRRMGKLALRNRQRMESQRMTITYPSPKTK